MSRHRTRRSSAGGSLAESASAIVGRVRENVRSHSWWHTTLVVIGFVSLATAVSVMVLGVNNAPRTVVTDARVPPVHAPAFMLALSRLIGAPVEEGGTIDILDNGDEFLPALLQAFEEARQTINFSVYIWDDGEFSDRVLDALIRRQREGVSVRVLLDGLGGRKAPDDRFEELREAGGRVERFRTPRLGTWTRFHRRNHRRSIVMDGQVGFTGGMAVGDYWLGHAQDADHWRDMMFRLTGPLASSLQGAFVDAWAGSTGEILVGPGVYPEVAADATLSTTSGPRFIHHVNSPADDDQSMAYFFLAPVLAARNKVYLTTPYFIPDDPLKAALAERARAGVDVRLLLPGPEIDNLSVRLSGQNHYDALMDAGVRIYEYQPTFLHSKYMVVDGQWSVIGSPNVNSRSRYLDEENAFGILDSALGGRLEASFLTDLERAEELSLDDWRSRGATIRLLQLSARILDQQS